MNCEQARRLAALACSDDIAPPGRRGLDSHIARCAECRAEMRAFEAMCGQLAEMRQESAPEQVYAAVRARVAGEIGDRPRSGWLRAWPALVAALACSVILVVVLHRGAPVVAQPMEQPPERVEIAGAQDVAASIPITPPVHRARRPVARAQAREPAEPLVVHMFTDDPEVVIYWIADARGKKAGKEIIQ